MQFDVEQLLTSKKMTMTASTKGKTESPLKNTVE
jgi:hypothetical protein